MPWARNGGGYPLLAGIVEAGHGRVNGENEAKRRPENNSGTVPLPNPVGWRDDARELPIFLSAGSFYGWIRNWMGLESVSTLVYDDPAWFEEMVTTVADCVLGVLERVLATGGKFEGCGLWEDMCYRGVPPTGGAA